MNTRATNNKVELDSTLINKNEKIYISFITTSKIKPKIDTRIIGISNVEIKEKKDKSEYFGRLYNLMSVLLIGILIGIISLLWFKNDAKRFWLIISSYLLIGFLFWFLIIIL